MPTVGTRNDATFNYWLAWGLNTSTQVAKLMTMPENGVVNGVGAYFGGDGVTLPNCRLCVWNSGGTLVAQSSSFSQPSGARSSQGQQWAYLSVPDYTASSGDNLYIGYIRDHSTWHVYGLNISSGSHYTVSQSTNTPISMSGASTQSGSIGAYFGYYVPGSGTDGDPNPPVVNGGIKTWDGSNFIKHPVKVWNGSSWVWRPVKTWSGSTWVRRG